MLDAPVWREPNFANAFAAFRANVAEVFAQATGGRHYSFVRQRRVEQVLSEIGAELHTQYLLSFTPRRDSAGRFHTIRVTLANREGLGVRNRVGYWAVSE